MNWLPPKLKSVRASGRRRKLAKDRREVSAGHRPKPSTPPFRRSSDIGGSDQRVPGLGEGEHRRPALSGSHEARTREDRQAATDDVLSW